jgi:DNA-binding winged helix-turn-helix (wHTH) protein
MAARLLAERAGLTKEQLAREVWGVTRYRPDRDDKRVFVAINRLRKLLRDTGGVLSLENTPTGYALVVAEDACAGSAPRHCSDDVGNE